MPQLDFSFVCLQQRLDNGRWLAEALLFPEISCLAGDPSEAVRQLVREVRSVLKALPVAEHYRRRLAGPLQLGRTRVRIAAPKSAAAWRSPIELEYPYVFWPHGDTSTLVALIPELDLEVLCTRRSELKKAVRREIRRALVRQRAHLSLQALVARHRRRQCVIRRLRIRVPTPTPKEAAQRQLRRDERQKSVLKLVAEPLRRGGRPEAFELDNVLHQMAQWLTGREVSSVLLVGPSGVGKTAAVRELARRGAEPAFTGPKIWSTSGSRLVAGMSGFGMWQERCEQLVREAEKSQVAIHVENLVELIEVGKSEGSSQGIASFLRPFIQQRRLQLIAECTPEQLPVIERQDPQLLDVFQTLHVREPSPEVCHRILHQQAIELGGEGRLDAASLDALDRLHRRYATYSSNPGRAVRFLNSLLRDRRGDIAAADVVREFSRETGLPRFLLDPETPLDLTATRARLAKQVMGQAPAVDLVVDVLSAVKSGLARPGRPIASLMFIGPTGVGKTELAKALCKLMYRDPGRMVRLDMSEYASGTSVDRLIGAFGGRGALTDRIREQPFTVVLLDEFEKAHPRFQDLLLQVLGEGRLTDGGGRLADFRNAIVILTSNLGADTFGRAAIGFGDDSGSQDAAARHFQTKVREAVRPELFNRLDRIVPFAPLQQDVIQAIASRELQKIRHREGLLFRGVTLDVSPEVLEHLARAGYQPRYGAALEARRALERQLVQPLADELNRYQGDTALEADATWEDGQVRLRVRARRDAAGRTVSRISQNATLMSQCVDTTRVRRRIQRLEVSAAVRQLENDIYRLQRLQKRLLEQPRNLRALESAGLRQLASMQALAGRITSLSKQAAACEDTLRIRLYENTDQPAGSEDGQASAAMPAGPDGQTDASALTEELGASLMELFLLRSGRRNRLCLCGFSLQVEPLRHLFSTYLELAERRGFRRTLSLLRRHRIEEAAIKRTRLKGRRVRTARNSQHTKPAENPWVVDVIPAATDRPTEALEDLADDVLGVALELEGQAVYELLGPERGRHVFIRNQVRSVCLVEAIGGALGAYSLPAGIDRAAFFQQPIREAPLRRSYDFGRERLSDDQLGTTARLQDRDLPQRVIDCVEAFFQSRLEELVQK